MLTLRFGVRLGCSQALCSQPAMGRGRRRAPWPARKSGDPTPQLRASWPPQELALSGEEPTGRDTGSRVPAGLAGAFRPSPSSEQSFLL